MLNLRSCSGNTDPVLHSPFPCQPRADPALPPRSWPVIAPHLTILPAQAQELRRAPRSLTKEREISMAPPPLYPLPPRRRNPRRIRVLHPAIPQSRKAGRRKSTQELQAEVLFKRHRPRKRVLSRRSAAKRLLQTKTTASLRKRRRSRRMENGKAEQLAMQLRKMSI